MTEIVPLPQPNFPSNFPKETLPGNPFQQLKPKSISAVETQVFYNQINDF